VHITNTRVALAGRRRRRQCYHFQPFGEYRRRRNGEFHFYDTRETGLLGSVQHFFLF
jgi:hypothetical protein